MWSWFCTVPTVLLVNTSGIQQALPHLSCCPKKRASTCPSFSRRAFAGQNGKPFSFAHTSGWGWLYSGWGKIIHWLCCEPSELHTNHFICGVKTYAGLAKPVVSFLARRQVALRTHLDLIHLQRAYWVMQSKTQGKKGCMANSYAIITFQQSAVPRVRKSWRWPLRLRSVCDYLKWSQKVNSWLRRSMWTSSRRNINEIYLRCRWCSCARSISCQQERLQCSRTFSF